MCEISNPFVKTIEEHKIQLTIDEQRWDDPQYSAGGGKRVYNRSALTLTNAFNPSALSCYRNN